MDFEFLSALEEDWRPVSRPALIGWLLFFIAFLLYALRAKGEGLLIDLVFVPIHEGGHLLFGWLGQWPGVLGGTFLQLFVPAALAAYFVFERQSTATALCSFLFFENFLGIAAYMADSLAQEGNYVTVGEGGDAVHDWFFIFSNLGLLGHFQFIARVVRVIGWLGMLGAVAWLVKRARPGLLGSPTR